jgi:hypothetical protein
MKILLLSVMLLAGCASNKDFYAAEAQRHATEATRWKAMADIAIAGDTTAKAVALAVMGSNGNTSAPTAAPANEALQWASILVPGLTQVAGMRYNYLSQQNASTNATALGMSTNSTFANIAGKIQAPSITNTLSGTGTLGSGAYTTTEAPFAISPTVVAPVTPIVPTVITPVVPLVPTVVTPVTPLVPTVITPVVPIVPTVIQPTVIQPTIIQPAAPVK